MANLVIPRQEIWTRQPQGPVDIDWANPITRGLVSATLPSFIGLLGKDKKAGDFSSTNILVDNYGVAFGRKDFDWGVAQKPVPPVAITSDMTLLSFIYGDSTSLSESQPVTTGQNAAAVSSAISVGNGTTKALRYRIYLNGTRYAGGSFTIPATPTVVVGRHRYGIEQALFVGGNKDPITANFTGPSLGVTHFGSYAGNKATFLLLSAFWERALSDIEIKSLSDNPWQIFAPRETYVFPEIVGGGINATGSGSLSPVSISNPTGSASGSASVTGAFAAITIAAPTATASAGGSASASGSLASLTITSPTATASASGVGSGAWSALSISPATGTATATKSATASGSVAAINITAPAASATGTAAGNAIATATPAQITISPATASAIASAVASGSLASLSVSPLTGSATSAGHAQAIATFAALSINPATGAAYASAIATGALPIIAVSPPSAYASNGNALPDALAIYTLKANARTYRAARSAASGLTKLTG